MELQSGNWVTSTIEQSARVYRTRLLRIHLASTYERRT